jgi:hypothetical protein
MLAPVGDRHSHRRLTAASYSSRAARGSLKPAGGDALSPTSFTSDKSWGEPGEWSGPRFGRGRFRVEATALTYCRSAQREKRNVRRLRWGG